MKKLRKRLNILLPAIILVMIAGLVLSRVYRPDPGPASERTAPHERSRSTSPSPSTAPAGPLQPEFRIGSAEAGQHTGRTAEVCGLVTGAEYIPAVGGEPTFLNFGDPYPDHHFTVVVWGEHRDRWDVPPHQLYNNRRICITGTIRMHRDKPQIVASDPGQFRFADR